jgi:hypothetical protein
LNWTARQQTLNPSRVGDAARLHVGANNPSWRGCKPKPQYAKRLKVVAYALREDLLILDARVHEMLAQAVRNRQSS